MKQKKEQNLVPSSVFLWNRKRLLSLSKAGASAFKAFACTSTVASHALEMSKAIFNRLIGLDLPVYRNSL